MLDQLKQDGWNTFRYYSCPSWSTQIPNNDCTGWIDYEILRHLIEEAEKRGIYIMLNIAHNFPTSAFIDGRRDLWINQYLADLNAINAKDHDNLIFDLANEYTGSQSNVIAQHFQCDLRRYFPQVYI